MNYIKLVIAAVAVTLVTAICVYALTERNRANGLEAEKATLTQQLTDAVQINKTQVQAIERLTRQADIDQKVSSDLSNKLTSIQIQADDTRQAIEELRNNAPEARTFLDTPVPDSVKRLYRKP